MTAYFNTPELQQIRKAVEDLDKREDELEDQMKKRELAIATQLAATPQPAAPAAQPTATVAPVATAAQPTAATPATPAAAAAPTTATNDFMAALFLAAYHEVYDNQYENGSIAAFLQQ